MNNRITWKPAADGGMVGCIGPTQTIAYGIRFRPECNKRAPWVVTHRLPFQQDQRTYPTAKDAQQAAERSLMVAAEMLGFYPIAKEEVARLYERADLLESMPKPAV